jgi:ribosomal protein S18 acetylase RimI-like enzyme
MPARPTTIRNAITIRWSLVVRRLAAADGPPVVAGLRFERRFRLSRDCAMASRFARPAAAGDDHHGLASRGVSPDIRPADRVDDELVAAFAVLIPQLSSSSPPPSADELAVIVDSPDSVLYVARIGGDIVGTLTLAFYRIPTGLKAWIEDVVVSSGARGHGVGEALNRAAIAEAAHRGAKNVSLTSRPSRAAANRLYQRLGFEPYETNIYRYTI